jgi:tetratricopeptide (TPR) repeat protein
LLERALELDPRRESEVFAQRLAGAYFLSQQYEKSVRAYNRALELAAEQDAELLSRRADALLYAGQYRPALTAFRDIEPDDDDLERKAWIYVKGRALSWVIETTGIEEQDRHRARGDELAGRLAEVEGVEGADELASQVWASDAVSSLGWFNRARDLLDRGLEEDAMHSYLTAAVMNEGDVEAWVNVALLAINVKDAALLEASVITGHRLNRPQYMSELARQLRDSGYDVAMRQRVLTLIQEALASIRR